MEDSDIGLAIVLASVFTSVGALIILFISLSHTSHTPPILTLNQSLSNDSLQNGTTLVPITSPPDLESYNLTTLEPNIEYEILDLTL